MIVYTIIQILLTLAGAGVIGYSIYLTIQVSGDKLLTLDSELGYRYATSYHRWQLYAGIAIVSLLILWSVYILIVRAYRVKHREERLAKKAEKKNEKKIAREQKKQKKTTSEYIQPVNAQNMQQPYAQGYYPDGYAANVQGYAQNGYEASGQGYVPNGYEASAQGYALNDYEASAQGCYPSGYEANTQGYYPNSYNADAGYYPNGYEANAQGYYPNGYNADEQGYASNAYDVNTQIYDQMANSQDISTDKADSQEMKQEWNGKE